MFDYLFIFIFLVYLLSKVIRYLAYPDLRFETGRSILFWLAFFPGYYLSVLAHEVGHIYCGFIAGFKFVWMSVGKIILYVNPMGKLRLSWGKHLSSFGGCAAMTTHDERWLRWRYILVISGGVLGNLFLLLLVIIFARYSPDHVFIRNIITLTFINSLISCIINLIPFRYGGLGSDGLNILDFLRGKAHMRRTMALLLLSDSAREQGVSTTWNARWIEESLTIKDNSLKEAVANFYAHQWALAKKDEVAAEKYLVRTLELIQKLDAPTTTLVRWIEAYFLAMHKNDAVVARTALEKSGSNIFVPAYYPLRAEAAVLFAEGHFEASKVKAQEGIKVYKELGGSNYEQGEFNQLEDILAKAENALGKAYSLSSSVT